MNNLLRICTIAAGLIAHVASATTYFGNQLINGASVNYSITTDGFVGVLNTSHILAFTVSVTGLNDPFAFASTDLAASNSGVSGNAFTSTASALSFNYSQSGSHSVVFRGGPVTAFAFLALNDFFPTSLVQVYNGTGSSNARGANQTGTQIMATVAAAAVPEPASWATMVLGLGLVGFTIRRRAQRATAAAA